MIIVMQVFFPISLDRLKSLQQKYPVYKHGIAVLTNLFSNFIKLLSIEEFKGR